MDWPSKIGNVKVEPEVKEKVNRVTKIERVEDTINMENTWKIEKGIFQK